MGNNLAKKLIAMVVVLGLCIGGYVWINNYQAKKDASDNKDETKVLIDVSKDTITEISYEYDDEKVNLKLDLKKKKWYSKDHKKWPLIQDNITNMVDSLKKVSAIRTVKTDEDMSQYELEKPQKIIRYKTKKGKEYVINIGRVVSAVGCYSKVNDDKNVYIIDETIDTVFQSSELSLVEIEKIPSFESSLVYYVEAKGEDFNMKAEYDGDITEMDSGKWILKKPYDTDVRGMESSFIEYLPNIESFTFAECIDVGTSSKKLKKYGFDDPYLYLKLKFMVEKESENDSKDSDDEKKKYKKDDLTIILGKTVTEEIVIDEDDNVEENVVGYYAMLEGSDRIYMVEMSTVQDIIEARAYDFVYNAVNNKYLIEYDNLKITVGDDKYTLKKVIKERESNEEKAGYEYIINGKKYDEDEGDKIYDAISGLSYDKDIGKKKIKKDKTIATLKYKGKKGGEKSTTIKFLNYDDNYYRVRTDDIEYFLISKIEVDQILEDLEQYKKK